MPYIFLPSIEIKSTKVTIIDVIYFVFYCFFVSLSYVISCLFFSDIEIKSTKLTIIDVIYLTKAMVVTGMFLLKSCNYSSGVFILLAGWCVFCP